MHLSFISAMIQSAVAVAQPHAQSTSSDTGWVLGENASGCAVTRTYAPSSEPVRLEVRPPALEGFGSVLLVLPGAAVSAPVAPPGDSKFKIDGRELPRSVRAGVTAQNEPGSAITLERGDLASLSSATTIELSPAPGRTMKLPLDGLGTALRTVERCNVLARARWGISPSDWNTVAQTATGPAVYQLFGPDDYPPDALRAEAQGAVRVTWEISADGRATACRVIESAGTPSLDERACAVILARARYVPAKDAAGNPIKSWRSQVIRWTIPG